MSKKTRANLLNYDYIMKEITLLCSLKWQMLNFIAEYRGVKYPQLESERYIKIIRSLQNIHINDIYFINFDYVHFFSLSLLSLYLNNYLQIFFLSFEDKYTFAIRKFPIRCR
jgi:hypothetical protein